jgi:hypothetical protein
MKKILSIIVLLMGLVISVSLQAQKNATWKEMDEFHTVMGSTFHPAEEGDLRPIKSRSQEMIDKAVAWLKSTAPEGYNKKTVKGSLKKLVKESKALHEMVKSGATDKDLVAKLNGLHDIFHEIMEKCSSEEHGEH